MHRFDAENRFLGGHGIVCGHIALDTGAAFRCKHLRNDVLCSSARARRRSGGFHEGLTLAVLWKLPIDRRQLELPVDDNYFCRSSPGW
jgi:pyruvate dehydrogenase E1 component alpha subunit